VQIGYVTRDVAQMISGKSRLPAMMGAMEISSHSHAGSVRDDFVSLV